MPERPGGRGKPRRRGPAVPALFAVALLAGCGQVTGLPTPHPGALPAGELGCLGQLRVVPSDGPPGVAQAEAEARARADSARWAQHRIGDLRAARLVTVLAGEGRPGVLGGRNLWLLVFDARPIPEQVPSVWCGKSIRRAAAPTEPYGRRVSEQRSAAQPRTPSIAPGMDLPHPAGVFAPFTPAWLACRRPQGASRGR
jgi:hypothetical protein